MYTAGLFVISLYAIIRLLLLVVAANTNMAADVVDL